MNAKARNGPTGASPTSRGKSKKVTKPRAKKQTPEVVECQHAWSDPAVARFSHYPAMTKNGVEAVGILICWRCGAVKARIEYDKEGQTKWGLPSEMP